MSEKLVAETELEAAALKEARFIIEHASLTTAQAMQLASQITHTAITVVVQMLFRKAEKAESIGELLEAFKLPELVLPGDAEGSKP